MQKLWKMDNRFFNLQLRVSWSERWFAQTYGVDVYNYIRSVTMDRDKRECAGCGFIPPHNPESFLFTHIISINQENAYYSPAVTLCNACHMTQHIDIAIANDYVKFINSSFTQNSLIGINKITEALAKNYIERKIIDLGISPEEILDRLRNNQEIEEHIKVIFTEGFQLPPC